jgi:uncharacterized protein YjbI with pentapeptide repeats
MKKPFLYFRFFQSLIILSFICLFILGGCAKYGKEVQANLTKLKNTKACVACDLTGIELVSFDLKNADLRSANLTGAKLRRSDLTGADLTGANLYNADLTGTKVAEKTLKDAVLCKTGMPSGERDNSDCKR